MVRKINKKEKKKKPVLKFVPTNEQIDKYIDDFIEYIKTFCDEEIVKKIKYLTKDNSNIKYMQQTMLLVKIFMRTDIPKDEKFKNDLKEKLSEMIIQYEKDYIPKMSTIFYLNLFAINKLISRYFKTNLYRKRFSKNNTNEYNSEVYKNISDMLETKPIQANKDRVFTGVWYEKILEISKKLDKILHRLDKYRENYIISKSVVDEFSRIKSSLNYEFSEYKKLTKKEINYIYKVFGNNDLAREIIKERNQDPCITYKYEYNFVLDTLLYLIIISSEKNHELLISDIAVITGNKFLAEDVSYNIKELTKLINIFLKNFENLICEAIDDFNNEVMFDEVYEDENNHISLNKNKNKKNNKKRK